MYIGGRHPEREIYFESNGYNLHRPNFVNYTRSGSNLLPLKLILHFRNLGEAVRQTQLQFIPRSGTFQVPQPKAKVFLPTTVTLRGSRVLQISLHFIRFLWNYARDFPTAVTLSEEFIPSRTGLTSEEQFRQMKSKISARASNGFNLHRSSPTNWPTSSRSNLTN